MSKSTLMSCLVTMFFVPTFAAWAGEDAERAAAALVELRMARERPQDALLLKAIKGKDIVVVAGEMDHIEQVLAATHVPFTLIQPSEVATYPLRSSMALMVNCPGMMPDAGVQHIQRFVRAGGLLYTTDWALRSIIEKAFPNTLAFAGTLTPSRVVPVSVDKKGDDLMSNILLRKGSQPQWWLDGGSFPVRVLDPKRVEVLAHSDVMAKEYGASPVVLRFRWEDGEVIHVVSHFFRQLDTSGPNVAAAQAVGSFEGLTDGERSRFVRGEGAHAKVGDVESSYAFQRMTTNLVTGKQKRNVELDREYNMTVSDHVDLKQSPKEDSPKVTSSAPHEAKMKVLERNAGKALVRDEFGNEGWVAEKQLSAW